MAGSVCVPDLHSPTLTRPTRCRQTVDFTEGPWQPPGRAGTAAPAHSAKPLKPATARDSWGKGRRVEKREKKGRKERGLSPPNRFKMRSTAVGGGEAGSLWGKPMRAQVPISNGGLSSAAHAHIRPLLEHTHLQTGIHLKTLS